MPCIYILHSKLKDKYYIGSSRQDSAIKRLKAHNNGQTKSTKYGRPWKVVYEEVYNDYKTARKREIFLKSGQGRKWFKNKLRKGARVVE